MQKAATVEDRKNWREKAEQMDLAQLDYAIRDCADAECGAASMGHYIDADRYQQEGFVYEGARLQLCQKLGIPLGI